jgi:hypothetical protein
MTCVYLKYFEDLENNHDFERLTFNQLLYESLRSADL